MSFAETVSPPSQAGRRFHARRRIEGLAYVEFGPDNGAILIDLGQGGLGFQSVMPVSMNQALLFKFKLPSETTYIEGYAEVAWRNESGKGGGLRFVELGAEACAQIRQWTGVLAAPETSAIQSGKAVEANSAQENSPEPSAADATAERLSPENGSHIAPAPASEVFNEVEVAQPPQPEIEELLAAAEAAEAAKAAEQEFVAEQSALPQQSAIPEFTIEVEPTPEPHAATSGGVERATPAAPQSTAANTAGLGAVARERAVPAHTPAAAPAKPARPVVSDPTSFALAQKRQRKPAPKPEPSPAAYDEQPAFRGSFTRQAQKPAQSEWERMPFGAAEESKPELSLLSQAIKIGIGVAAGAGLVLALVFGVPSLRTRVQATANARSAALNAANAPAFQVEVADLNNRRWILRSGGDAGSPFGDTPSRRESQPASARAESKSSRPEESNDSSDAAEAPKSKLPRPGELALSRPHAASAPETSAQLIAPSIFDGITPPIGSVTDRLAAGGPEAPGIVPPESQPGIRTSALESAVLVQRVAPVYPPIALAARLQGDVLVNATIGTNGIPKDLKVIRGDQRLVAAALAAISEWRYRPATLAGRPVETQTVVTVSFQMK